MKITKEKAIEIASKEAIELGYDIKSMKIEIHKYNTPWNKYLTKVSSSKYANERKNKLINKEYWAVYYCPKQTDEIILGGDLCIFINSKDGVIITCIKGE